MRFALIGVSLLSLLVVVAIMLSLQSAQLPAVRAGLDAQVEAGQIAGVDKNTGMRATESATFQEMMSGSRLRGVKVISVVAGGPMQDYFGLMPGDEVTEIIGLARLGDISNDDPDLAKAQVFEAYQRRQVLGVVRPGVGPIQLPQDRNKLPAAVPLATPAAGQSSSAIQPPAVPAPANANPPAPKDDRSSLQKQLDIVSQPR